MSNSNLNDILFQLDEFYLDLGADGQISFIEKSEIRKTPFPGLRPFKTSEFQLFHGRDGQAEQLINRLKKNHFLAVIGSSGTGKSSLIRAGLIPQLLGGYLQEAGTNWDIAICRPGKNPVENLAFALARIKSKSNEEEKILHEYKLLEPLLSDTIYGILEVNDLLNPLEAGKSEKKNLLIIVDQFEELFRFNRDDLGKPGIEIQFVNLLLKASANPNSSIYVIITMRSEFLGDTVKFRGLPEAINEGQYLVPQLSRDQIKEVIEDPIKLADKQISAGLVELLINEIEESKAKKDLDQLPVLQHALMRTYQEAMKKPEVVKIEYDHYKACGGMEKALANHAEKKYSELADKGNEGSFKQEIAKIIFQALTDASTDQKRGRRPTDLKTLYSIAASLKAGQQQVDEVINHFRDTETSFIMPPLNTELYPELIMDISHESLMRQWSRLREWVAEESENGKMLMRLAEYQKLNQQGKKDYLEGKELQQLSDWYYSFKPQHAWAQRYSADYKQSFKYLQQSEVKWEIKQSLIAKEIRRKSRRSKIFIFSVLGLILITVYLVNWYNKSEEDRNQKRLAIEKAIILSKNRDRAIGNENKLQALFFTTEALLLEKNQNSIDSLIKNSIRLNLIPTYSLKSYFLCPSTVNKALPGPDYKTIYAWTDDSTLYELDTETGKVIRSAKYEPEDQDNSKELIPRTKIKLFSKAASTAPDTKDTVLIDSSLFFKRRFTDIFDKDAAGFNILPQIIRIIYGALYTPDGKTIATWGKNSESMYDAVDLWDQEGFSTSLSLIHDGVKGVAFSNDKNLLFTWGADSTIRLWQKTEDTIDAHMPAKLIKMKIQLITGVEMDEKDYNIKIIPVRDYKIRREEFMREEKEYKNNTASVN
ncbi:MAG: hypothetical protein JWQ09_4306 [Segetibacter sp.]|nr:hypothetical protein [Segetibacter sp.]